MPKEKRSYQCQSCGARHSKWAGQCGTCGEWNSLLEAGPAPAPPQDNRYGGYTGNEDSAILSAAEVTVQETSHEPTGIRELDRVLGGGLVAGSVVLLGGDPGIGKSTLLLQVLTCLHDNCGAAFLYVTGEESLEQVILRAQRLALDTDELRLLAETRVEQILALAQREKPRVMVIDSIQTIYTEALGSAPGGVAQVRESTARLVRFAKQTGTVLFLAGHVTKEGALAGPRVLEHMVDTVLYFESEASSRFRIIRAVKNRFGAVNELGIFAMTEKGLREVENPSQMMLVSDGAESSGSVIMATRQGTRPLLVEVQALVDDSALGNPRRVTVGLEQNRLAMLLAVLSRHGGVASLHQDVFVNVVGGVRIGETAADLPVVLAVLSSLRDRPVSRQLLSFGEVGLAGEIRPVPYGEERLREAAKHGFQRAVIPKGNAPRRAIKGLEIVPVTRLHEALAAI